MLYPSSCGGCGYASKYVIFKHILLVGIFIILCEIAVFPLCIQWVDFPKKWDLRWYFHRTIKFLIWVDKWETNIVTFTFFFAISQPDFFFHYSIVLFIINLAHVYEIQRKPYDPMKYRESHMIHVWNIFYGPGFYFTLFIYSLSVA